ncbi:DUF6468 domain-containing protein [Elioraea sp.]|jgi:hypothetical protein|uniref:DUF6468 domain-containing protein n=1 Tax=Elioraea sp. TaxID=2185103 RepID=UPI0021DEC049|nr:DUF6468 domain-containing protein [Elioraea sp.]GIX08376.1 MAG: hypothetical protein KatS3mg116_0086 [Elioraea sp.]
MITLVQWGLEALLLVLLAATLLYAVRLERRLGVLRRDNAALEALVAGFNEATARAEASTARLRAAAEGAGQQVAAQTEAAERLRGDLVFLIERGEALADRLDARVRDARALANAPEPRAAARAMAEPPAEAPKLRSQAERDLMQALRLAR